MSDTKKNPPEEPRLFYPERKPRRECPPPAEPYEFMDEMQGVTPASPRRAPQVNYNK